MSLIAQTGQSEAIQRLQYPELRRQIASLAARHGAETILIENVGPGMTLLQELRRDLPPSMQFRP